MSKLIGPYDWQRTGTYIRGDPPESSAFARCRVQSKLASSEALEHCHNIMTLFQNSKWSITFSAYLFLNPRFVLKWRLHLSAQRLGEYPEWEYWGEIFRPAERKVVDFWVVPNKPLESRPQYHLDLESEFAPLNWGLEKEKATEQSLRDRNLLMQRWLEIQYLGSMMNLASLKCISRVKNALKRQGVDGASTPLLTFRSLRFLRHQTLSAILISHLSHLSSSLFTFPPQPIWSDCDHYQRNEGTCSHQKLILPQYGASSNVATDTIRTASLGSEAFKDDLR